MAGTRKLLDLHIRWMIRRDMPEVEAIEVANFEDPWSGDDFIRCLRQRTCIGLVAEYREKVAGFVVYELHNNRLHILNLAVHAAMHRKGVGTSLIAKLVSKLSPKRRHCVMCEVRESNLEALLFLKAVGFRAISLLRDFYEDSSEDAYLMRLTYRDGCRLIQVPSAVVG